MIGNTSKDMVKPPARTVLPKFNARTKIVKPKIPYTIDGTPAKLVIFVLKKGKLQSIIQTNITNLAGVPSIVYGILGLTIFVRALNLGNTVLAGGLTMSLLVLPIIVSVSQEAIRAVPHHLSEASYGLGATKWQT